MEYRQKYENLLQTLCNAYNKMFKLLEGVEHCDKELARLSRINRPSVEEVCRITEYKERLIVTTDRSRSPSIPYTISLTVSAHSARRSTPIRCTSI